MWWAEELCGAPILCWWGFLVSYFVFRRFKSKPWVKNVLCRARDMAQQLEGAECFSTGSRLNSQQHLYSGLQPSVTLVTENPAPSCALCACTWCTDTRHTNTCIHKQLIRIKLKIFKCWMSWHKLLIPTLWGICRQIPGLYSLVCIVSARPTQTVQGDPVSKKD